MAWNDVTAKGVEQAIAEFDRLGQKAFLSKYGFGKARDYFLIHRGKRYDSKAIVGVAHGYDRSDLGSLSPQGFSGGDATVARHLESLGFDIERPPRNPPWSEEELVLALDLYLRRGILRASHPEVVDLSRVLNGLAIHSEPPDLARFRNPNGVALKLSNFAAFDPTYDGRGMTRGGKLDTQVWDQYASDEDKLSAAVAAIRDGRALAESGEPQTASPSVVYVNVEEQHIEEFPVSIRDEHIVAHRREQSLVLAYRDHLESQGHKVKRGRYPLSTRGSALVCDLVDLTEGVLYEAKGDINRSSVRMAIGQLLDYRHLEPSTVDLAVLLPRKPTQDIIDLILSVPAAVVWRTSDGFEMSKP